MIQPFNHTIQENYMKTILPIMLFALLLAIPSPGQALFGDKDPDKERKELREERDAALKKLYSEKPDTRDQLKSSVGYAVFSNLGVNLFLVSTERGGGILRNNRDGSDTYMKMFSAGGGLGMGIKDFVLVFVFHTASAMEEFQTSGWDFGAQADAAAESGNKGAGAEGAATVMPGTTIYQLTDAGLALQATVKGTKFWPDEDLN
jgi:lipid-binding SYLF domain-containing protein